MRSSNSICFGQVAHKRFTPKQHQFSYPYVMPLVDLDSQDDLKKLSKLLSVDAEKKTIFSLYRFCENDYLKDYRQDQESLKCCVIRLLKHNLKIDFTGKVLLLGHWRFCGFVFNPITLFYCINDSGKVEAIITEVSNTPWNERYLYFHHLPNMTRVESRKHKKAFHVSPFNPMNMTYGWKFGDSEPKFNVSIALYQNDEKHFRASFNLSADPMNSRNFYRMLRMQPLFSAHTVIRIYWQALKLFFKRIPIYNHSKRNGDSNGSNTTHHS